MPKQIKNPPSNPPSKPQPRLRKKRRGGGLGFLLLLLIAGGGTAFYFGWVSFRLNEGEYGVVFTKTSGYHKDVLIPGTFVWLPEALLPTNLSLHVLKPEVQVFNLKREGKLPSGSVYAETAGINTDFSWTIQARITYRIKPDALPGIASSGLQNNGLQGVYKSFENQSEESVLRLAAENNTESDSAPNSAEKSAVRLEDIQKRLRAALETADDRIIVSEVSILQWDFPDPALYEGAKEFTSDFMKQRAEKLSALKGETILREERQNAQIEMLKRYGALIDEHPKLIEFLPLLEENEANLASLGNVNSPSLNTGESSQ